ncbi:hypothetical protein VST63_23090 [Mycolicibacterium sp. 050232]|uniref:hypothetical protein n=1 Tax=Mycolicibacterium sp. 050232 TaxID=3113982 RepID=UPI002E2D33B5|nr:hypothetical protein [Mycolicibacterium sp. 050232]MED5815256.1 hypothetical protein [Mycolicibacterium sp. 050232]
MWVRYNMAPWWARWLVTSAWMALWFLLFCWAVIQPRHHWWTPWPMWVVIAGLAGFGLLAAVPITLLTQPVVNTYATVLDGLTRPQRTAVARALRTEPIPTDPAVLTAAVRAADLARAYRNKVTPTRRRLGWVLIGIFAIALPVLEFLADRPQLALLYLALALVILVLQAGPEWIRRRRAPHLARLRAAAAADPQVAAAVAQTVSPAVPTPRERWLRVGLVVILAIGAGVAVGFLSHTSNRDCRTATAAARYISDQEDLLDARRIGPGGPDLAEYREWSDHLQRYADRVSEPGLGRHLQQIADLSATAVSIVEHARTPAAANDTTGILPRSYLTIVRRLIDTDTQMLKECTR